MRFEFATANRIIFGPGTLREIPKLAGKMGRRAFVVTGRTAARAHPLLELLAQEKIEHLTFPVTGEPTTDLLNSGITKAREFYADHVISFGGGSVIDAGKAIAGLLTNAGGLLDYLEVIGTGRALEKPSLPYIAVPTTAGPGTEVTRNAVLTSPEHRVKVSLRSPYLLPSLAVVDPEVTYNLPPAITASTGLDALTQLIEPYVSSRANPMTDAICRDGMTRVGRSLLRAFRTGSDIAARTDMSLASLYGGLALANAGLGAVHGFAGPIGGMFPAPHGAVCAALLPQVMEVNLRALRERQPASEPLLRFDEIAQILLRDPRARANDGIAWLKSLCASLQVPKLRDYGMTLSDLPLVCEKAGAASSMKGNPITLAAEELREVLERSW